MRARYTIAIFGVLMLLCGRVSAQEIDFDYRAYKFYKDEEPLLVSLDDTVRTTLPKAGYVANVARMADYALRSLNYQTMGERSADSYTLGRHNIDYTTARMLSHLRLYSEAYEGLGDAYISSSVHSTKIFDPNTKLYRGHSLRTELSGRGHLGSVTYYGGYKPDYKGVLLKDGWAFRHAVRVAGGDDLYIDGVYADILDLSFGATWSDRRSKLNIFTLLPMSERGLRRATVEEGYSLLGNRLYNPLWGMDNGKMRNSRVATMMRPQAIVAWDYKLSVSTTMQLTADLYYAMEGVSSLSWFDASTPLPDNYHYLPSYYDNPADSKYVTDAWSQNDLRFTQVDWASMRHTNTLQTDGHARYVVESRREDVANGDIVLAFDSKLRGLDIDYGVHINASNYHRYKVLDDLLGAQYIYDLDYYFVDDATHYNGTQNNLRNDDIVISKGEVFGYNYDLRSLKAEAFGRADWEYAGMRFSASGNIGSERITRHGYFEKERFLGAGSYGKSQSVRLNPYIFAVAWSYVMDNQTFGFSAFAAGESPDKDDLFFNPEYNNRVVSDVVLAKHHAAKLSYAIMPNMRMKLSALLYANSYMDGTEVVRYYDDRSGFYSNGIVKGVSWLSYGLDLGVAVDWNRVFASNFRALFSSCRYSDNAELTLYANEDNHLISHSDVLMKGVHRGSAEVAIYGDISFNYSGWRATASLSWCDDGYVAPSYIPRSKHALDFARSKEERAALLSQRDLPMATSVDLSVNRYLKFGDDHSLSVKLSVRNLLGGSWAVGGYEANRVRFVSRTYYTQVYKFADMLTYSYPRMLHLSLNLWF